MASSPTRRFISLLTDWGTSDPYAAICHGVILRIARDATVVDLTHGIDKFNVRHGALALAAAVPYLPVGAHVAVVDPGVGTRRRPLALRVERGDYLIGPDNGLLLPAAEVLGGIVAAHEIDNTDYRLPAVSSTFHGRDLFSPAAAHLVSGIALDDIGPPIDADSLVSLDWPATEVTAGALRTAVVYVDSFGNLKLGALPTDLTAALGPLREGDEIAITREGGEAEQRMAWATTFGAVGVGSYLLYVDSYGRVCIGQNQGNAAQSLGMADGAPVTIRRGE